MVTCALGVFVCFPRWSDAERVRSLELVDAAAAELDVTATEQTLLSQAQSSQTQRFVGEIGNTLGQGVSELSAPVGAPSAGNQAPALFRAVPLGLKTLGDVVEQSRSGREVTLAGPHPDNLVASLRWRFARIEGTEAPKLMALRTAGDTSEAQLEAEEAVEPARQISLSARKEYDRAHARFGALTDRVKAMAKANAPGKEQWKVLEKRREAQAEMETAQAAMESSLATYRQRADAASAATFASPKDAAQTPGVVVVASLKLASGAQSEWQIPVRRVERAVLSPAVPVPGVLDALSREPAWSALKDKTVSEAQQQIRDSVSWHLRGDRLGPFHVGGASLLHVFPLLLLALSFWLSQQCGRVHRVYNPFDHPGTNLHRLGTDRAKLDVTLLVFLVMLVVALDIWTLSRIDAEWWLALVFGAGAIGYAVLVAQAWNDLQELRTNIVRTSFPPPLG